MSDINTSVDVIITGAEKVSALVRKLKEAQKVADDINVVQGGESAAVRKQKQLNELAAGNRRLIRDEQAADRERRRQEQREFRAERELEQERRRNHNAEIRRIRAEERERNAPRESFRKAKRQTGYGVTYSQSIRGVTKGDVARGQMRNLSDDSKIRKGLGVVGYENQRTARNSLNVQRMRDMMRQEDSLMAQRNREVLRNLKQYPQFGGMLPPEGWAPPSKAPRRITRTPAEYLQSQRSSSVIRNLRQYPQGGGMLPPEGFTDAQALQRQRSREVLRNLKQYPDFGGNLPPPGWTPPEKPGKGTGAYYRPGERAMLRVRAARNRFRLGRAGAGLSGGLQGMAFPLIFGQGMGGVAGGGLGGLLGGLALGPGGSFAGAGLGTAIGASFDAVSTRIKVLAKDLDDPAKALEAIAAAGVKVSDSERAMSAYLESIGRSGDAFDMARNKMDAAFGPGSFAGLRVLQTSQNDFQAAITNLAGNLGQELLPTVISLTDYFTDLTSTAEPLIEVLGVLGEAFGTATVFIGNNAKFLVDLIAALGGDGDKVGKAFADRFNAKGFGDYQRSTKEKLEAARRNPAVEQRTTPFQDIEQAEKAYAEITRQRDATRGIEQESLSIARQREDIERSISDLQKKWSNTLKQQELQRAQLTSDNLRMGDDLAIERKMNEFDQMRQGLVSDDANALADNLAGYLRERANGEADLRQKEREFAIAKQRMAIEQSQLEEDTAKEVFSITRQAQDYTKAVEDYKIKVADYQYQRALDAMKLSTSMAAVGGGGGGRAGYTPVDLRGYTYGTQISKAAELADVDPRLLRGLVRQESNFSPTARSSAGAYGLTQLTPGTAREMGVTNINDVQQQLNAGAKYLRKMIDQFGSVEAGLRAYNQGPGNQQRSPGGVSQEAREYPGKVLGFAQQYGFSNQVASGPATGWIDKEEFRKWLYSQGMGRAPGDFTNAGHKTPNHMLNAMDMGFMDRKYDSNYVQKTMEMEAKLRATGAFGDQLFGPLSDPKGHGTHLHIPTPGGRVPYNNALAALMQGTGAAMPAGGMSPAAISRTPPTFQTPGGAPAVPSSAGFLASSRAGMEAQITQMEEALGLLRQIQDERAKAMLTNAVNIFQGDANRLSQLESQRDVSREIAAIDGTLPELQQELIANQIQYNAEADKLAASRRESFGVVEELVKLGQLEPEAAAKLNKLLADGYRQRQDILDVERQITEEAVLQARQKELQGAANRIVNFRRGYEAGYGPEAGAYNEALQTYGPGGARVVADAARVERRQQEAASDAQAIAGALTGGIVQAIKSGDFQQAASDALADVGGRLIERAFRPLEEYLMGMLTRLLAPGNAQTGGAAGGLLGLVPGLGSLFSGGGAAAGIGAFGNSGILGLGAGAFGFAKGGDPPVGRASLVGEEGPELFVPRTAGTIIPAADTSSIMDRYSRRSDGRNSTRPVQLSDDAGNAVTVGVRYEVTRVNDMRFVDEETFHRELDAAERRAARAGAEGGHAMVGRDMMNKRSIRSRWGVK